MKKSIKITVAVLAIALIIGAALAVSVSADETKTPEIISQNVYYDDVFSLMYAVSEDSVNEGPVTLNVYYEYPAEGVEIKHTYTAQAPETIQINKADVSAYVFTTNGVAAKSLTDNFYVQAVDKTGAKSEIKRYSVIEYMYQRLSGQQEITASQKQLYKTVIEFASWSTQVIVNEKDSNTSNDVTLAVDYSYVFFPAGDGLIGESSDATYGYEAGIWAKDTEVYPYIPGATNVTVTVYDDNFQPSGSTVIPNGTALVLSGDTTVITAGGEIAEPSYKPDLSDTAGRLTFEDNATSNSSFKLDLNAAGLSHAVTSGTPYGVASNVYKFVSATGNSGTEEINLRSQSVGAASSVMFVAEADMMIDPEVRSSWYAQVRGSSTVHSNYRFRADPSSGVVELVDVTGSGNPVIADVGEWFRYCVEYTQVDGAYVIIHYVNGEVVATETNVTGNVIPGNIDRLRIYSDSGAVGDIYFDNVKVEYK